MGGKTRRIYLLGLPLRVTLAPMSETLSYGERHRRRKGQEKTEYSSRPYCVLDTENNEGRFPEEDEGFVSGVCV